MSDRDWMARALELGRSALGRTAPNPAVGAIVVRDGQVLGEGHTRPAGGEHAEVVALRAADAAGHDCAGATLYTTLEPCCHHGRTPPCTEVILERGIGRVVAGIVDPFPAVKGRGLEQLRAHGLEVEVGVREVEARELILGFGRAVTRGLPEVTAKVAMSLDGRIATATGESQWITGEQARRRGHALRVSHDAILVGVQTVLVDDPRLTARIGSGADPVPVILDTHLRTPPTARVFEHPRRPVIVCGRDAPEVELPATVVRVPHGPGGIDVESALRALVDQGIHRVLVEGGGRVHRSMLDAGYVDRIHVFVGGVVLPGGRAWVGGPPRIELASAPRFRLVHLAAHDGDAELVYKVS